jgi:AcrR family transcriptional regulator
MAKMSTRDLILEVALVLLNERGESIVTSVDLANEMNISPGNLYYHFKGKEQVVEELYARFHALVLVTLQEIANNAKGDPKETLAGLAVLSEILQQFKFISQDLRGLSERYPRLRTSLSKILNLVRQTLVALVRLMMNKSKTGDFSDSAVLLADNIMYTLINFGAYTTLLNGDKLATEAIEAHLYVHFSPFI